jgi:hypothetical protein
MLALAYQSCAAIGHLFDSVAIGSFRDVTKVRTNVERVVPVETGELKLATFADMPNVVENERAIRGLFLLSFVDGVVGDIGVDRNQAGLICETVMGGLLSSNKDMFTTTGVCSC